MVQPVNVDEKYVVEWRKCRRSPAYFIDTYCQILNPIERKWIPFRLWKAQYDTLMGWHTNQYNIVLKARQLGLTWLSVAYTLWGMVTIPNFEAILVSKTLKESEDLMSPQRMRGMYERLPDWLKTEQVVLDNVRHWRLSNGSGGRTFAPKNVDSYSANIMILDESDYPAINLASLLTSAQPVIDGGGKLLLISRGYKDNPESDFKRLYRAAKEGKNSYRPYFLPWNVVDWRTPEWYERQKADLYKTWGSHDELYEQYPETDVQALAPRTLDKRIPSVWIQQVYREQSPLQISEWSHLAPELSTVGGVEVYELPLPDAEYRIGVDTAEGNPNSNDSAAMVVEVITGRQVAKLVGKHEPRDQAVYIGFLSKLYRDAPALIERNNHGGLAIAACESEGVLLLKGEDGKTGWLSNRPSKVRLYGKLATTIRDMDCTIVSFRTMTQVQSIDANTYSAPEGQMDDEADAYALAQVARGIESASTWQLFVPFSYGD